MEQRLNWAGNYRYGSSELIEPASMDEVRDVVARGSRIRVLGSRHSFNGIADTDGIQLSLGKLNRVISLDRERMTVTVEGGIRYGELCRYLDEQGFALHNLASLPHISVAGAVSTATHGSGDRNAGLAQAVRSIEWSKADGDLATLSRGKDPEFEGAVVGLGGLGAVTKLELDVVPAYRVSQSVYDDLPLSALADGGLDDIFSAAYSVSLFTTWQKPAFDQAWVKRKLEGDADESTQGASDFFGARAATAKRHPVPGQSAVNCSEQSGIPGPWHERLPHFRMDFTPSAGNELQSEYFVPRRYAYEALRALEGMRERIAPLLYVSEVRTIAADRFWMSPCYGQDSVGLHFTWKPEWESVRRLLPDIEKALAPFEARPHWAKLFTMEPGKVQSLYERLPDFRRLLLRYDPEGKFRNAYLDAYIVG